MPGQRHSAWNDKAVSYVRYIIIIAEFNRVFEHEFEYEFKYDIKLGFHITA